MLSYLAKQQFGTATELQHHVHRDADDKVGHKTIAGATKLTSTFTDMQYKYTATNLFIPHYNVVAFPSKYRHLRLATT